MLEQQQIQIQDQSLGMRVYWLLRRSDHQAVEALVAGVMLYWVFRLQTAPLLFLNSDVYTVMRRFGQPFWLRIAATIFLVHLVGAVTKRHGPRMIGLFFTAMWYLALAVMFHLSRLPNIGDGIHLALFIGAGWSFLRHIARQAGRHD